MESVLLLSCDLECVSEVLEMPCIDSSWWLQLHGPGTQQGDFHIDTSSVPGVVNLYGIESPGLTASMAIGEFVAGHLLQGQA